MSQELYTNHIKFLSSVEIQNDLLVNGNTGFGNTNPSEKLDVQGSAKISNNLYVDNNVHILSTLHVNNDVTMLGNLYVDNNVHILSTLHVNNDVTILGNLSALGVSTFANTVFTTTSSLCAYNLGPGPALYVYQTTGPYDIASFYDGDGTEVLHVGNAEPGGGGRVGINTGIPNNELTVVGSISATGSLYLDGNISIGSENVSDLTVSGNISAGGDLYIDGKLNQKDHVSVYSTVQTNSSSWIQNLSFNESTDEIQISDSNTVSLSSVTKNNKEYSHSNFLPLSGGILIGDLTVQGNLSSTGTLTYINTHTMLTSSVEVENNGTGPALKVTQTGIEDIATFYDDLNIALIIKDGSMVGVNTETPNETLTVLGNISSSGTIYGYSGLEVGNIGTATTLYVGNEVVGINNETPNEALSVLGNISSSNTIYDAVGNSNNWNDVYTSVNSTSSTWNDVYTSVNSTSSTWNDVYASVNSVSSNWNDVYTSVNSASSNWNDVYTSVNSASSNWNDVYTSVNSASSTWNDVYTSVNSVSSNWNDVYTSVNSVSSNWNDVYTSVNSASSTWNDVYTSVNSTSSTWNDVYTSVNFNSGNWNDVYTSVNSTSSTWNDVYTSVNPVSSNWNDVYTSVNPVSGLWNDVYTSVNPVSGLWNDVYTSVNFTSGGFNEIYTFVADNSSNIKNANSIVFNTHLEWDESYNIVRPLSGNWNHVYTSVNVTSANWNTSFNQSTVYSSNSSSYATTNFANSKFLPLSGGVVSGNLTIQGNLSTVGTSTQINTLLFVTSAAHITNDGTGPALRVTQTGNQDIASFYDDSNISLVIKDGGYVGVATNIPNESLTVFGNISSSGTVYNAKGNSNQWNDVYTSVNSASSNWNNVYTSVNSTSSTLTDVYTSVNSVSSNWNDVYTSVNSTSSTLTDVYTSVNSTSSTLTDVYTSVNSVSSNWNDVYTSVNPVSGLWNDVYTSVNSASSTLTDVYTSVNSTSSTLTDVYTSVNSVSSNWNDVYTSVNSTSSTWNDVYTSVNSVSSNWNDVYTSVNSTSSTWNDVYTSVNSNSGNWDSVYSTYQTNSSNYIEYSFLSSSYLPVSGGTMTGPISFGSLYGSKIDQGIYDSSRGGISGISLVCSVNYDFNWQAGWITALEQDRLTPRPLYIDSKAGTTLKVWDNSVYPSVGIEISHDQIIFKDSTIQDTAFSTTDKNKLESVYNNVGSLSANYDSVYTSVNSTSSNWNNVYASVNETSGTWNDVYTLISNVSSNAYLPLSGGIMTGGLTGTNAAFATSLEVGTGSAVLFVENLKVGINTESPNESLTIEGNLSASGELYANNYNSANWNDVYTSVNSTSSNWNDVYTSLTSNSSTFIMEDFIFACGDEITNLNVSVSASIFRIPFAMYLNSIRASVNTGPIGCGIVVDVKQNGSSLLSTLLTIDENTETSVVASVPHVVFNPNLIDDAKITVDIQQVGSTFAGSGLKLVFKGYRI